MPKQTAIPDIIKAILNGFIEAQKIYEEMSGGLWLCSAPEYFITTTVANKIHALPSNKYVTLETGSKNIIEDAGAKGFGRLPVDIREKGRVDILLWWATGNPRAIIEIKNQIYSTDQYEKDITRIKSCLKRNSGSSSLQFGVFAFYESASTGSRKTANEKVKDRVKTIYNNSKLILGTDFESKLSTTIVEDEQENDVWQAVCILIKLKNT